MKLFEQRGQLGALPGECLVDEPLIGVHGVAGFLGVSMR
jgi:hypothetical protein